MKKLLEKTSRGFWTMIGVLVVVAAVILIAGQVYHFFFVKTWSLDDWFGVAAILVLLVFVAAVVLFEIYKKKTSAPED
ncbi:MAG: hypothetical protein ACOZAG_02735 [Patescibacteria group bacterium]